MVTRFSAEGSGGTQFGLFLDADLSDALAYCGGKLSLRLEELEYLSDPFGEGLRALFIHPGGRGNQAGVQPFAPVVIAALNGGRVAGSLVQSHGYELAGECRVLSQRSGGQLHHEILCKRGVSAGGEEVGGLEGATVVRHVQRYLFCAPEGVLGRAVAAVESALAECEYDFGLAGWGTATGEEWIAIYRDPWELDRWKRPTLAEWVLEWASELM